MKLKPTIQLLGLLIAMLCTFLSASAYDFEVDGIYYNVLSLDDLTCEVTYNADNYSSASMKFGRDWLYTSYPSYTGNVTIPSKVNYKGRELSVTGIGSYAFLNCAELKSLSLPASIAQIKKVWENAGAFDYCGIETLIAGNAYILEMFNQSYAETNGCKTKDKLKNLVLAEDFSGTIGVDFSDYKKLVSIKSNVVEPPLFSEGIHFSNNQYLNILINVPSVAVGKYKDLSPWSKFWDCFAIDDSMTPPDLLCSYDFKVDDVYYNILSLDDLTCEVTYNADNYSSASMKFGRDWLYTSYPSYTGNVTIPSKVNYKGRELSVTGIGSYAFLNCAELKSLSLPASIAQIKKVWEYAGAFDYCGIETLIAGNEYILEMFNQSYAETNGCKTKDKLKNLILAEDFCGTIGVDFSDYKKLVSIRSNAIIVPDFSDGSHFSNEQYLNNEVLVPEKSFASYQSADVWKSFWDLKAMKSVTSITLNETSVNIEPKQTIQLVPTVLPEDAFDATVEWRSSNPAVASVDNNGLVTAISKGDAIVSVSSTDGSNISAQCSIHVDLLVKEIILSETEIGLEPGESKKLNVTIKPENAFVKEVIWTSDAENIASVDGNGDVIAKNIGTANISVKTTDGSDLTATCKVTVAELVKSITVTPNRTTIKEGEKLQLTCSISPETATYKNVVWKSENNDVASVDANGIVTAVSSGSATIKAIASDGSNVYGECSITVTAETIVIDGVCYQRNSPTTLKIVANTEKPYSGNLFIPSNVDFNGQDMKVTEIGTDAFTGCDNLTRIVIPNTVTKISNTAFSNCSNLVYVKICDGSLLNINLDNIFPNSPVTELYIGSNGITYNSDSKLLRGVKGMTLGGSVTKFPPAKAFKTLDYFTVEKGDNPMIEPEDYCSKSMSLINEQTIKDPDTHIYYRLFYLVTYTHLSPILQALENSVLNYVRIDRDIQNVKVDTSKTEETIPTTAGSRYQEFGYKDECIYSYQELTAKKEFNRNPIEKISFDKAVLELETGKSIYPTVIFNPENASFKTLVWSSSDDSVATVDMFGNVTKISTGTAEITAKTADGTNLSAKCKIVDTGAGVTDISQDFNEVKIIAQKGVVYILGYNGNQPIEIFEINGRLLITSFEPNIRLNSSGIFLVKVGTIVKKIIL